MKKYNNIKLYILTKEDYKNVDKIKDILKKSSLDFDILYTKNDLDMLEEKEENVIISHNTSVILSCQHILKFPSGAYNIHSAHPLFPGRDPHHFAIYFGSKVYGATLHKMVERVDEGEIIDVMEFPVNSSDTPYTLLERANECSLVLLEKAVKCLEEGYDLSKLKTKEWKWGERKFTRRDFMELCNITDCNDKEEIRRRIKAFYNKKYKNIYVYHMGYKFYIDIDSS